MTKIPGNIIDGLHDYFHSRKNRRKSRYIKPVFRQLAKNTGLTNQI